MVIAQKIVSKAEGCIVHLNQITPSDLARELAAILQRDPRKIEVILNQSRKVLRAEGPTATRTAVMVCETHHGFVCANAGVDESNLSEPETLLTLPKNPDGSAARIRFELMKEFGVELGVMITDSFGRPWRRGLVNVAIGLAGIPALTDYRGKNDSGGRPLTVTELAVADEIAGVAGLLMGKLDQVPAVLAQGLKFEGRIGLAKDLIRPAADDLYR